MQEASEPLPAIAVDIPPLGNMDNLRELNRQDISQLSHQLAGLFQSLGDSTIKTPGQDGFEYEYLRRLTEGGWKKGKLDLKGHLSVSPQDPDKLWVAAHVLYPQKQAEIAYYIIRSAQMSAITQEQPGRLNSSQIHQKLLQNPERLSLFNNRQIFSGPFTALRLLDQHLHTLELQKEQARLGRRRLLLKGATTLVGVGALTSPGAAYLMEQLRKQVATSASAQDTSSVSPTATTPTVESMPKLPENLFNEFIKPFAEEALRRRAAWSEKDPEYSHIIDEELNRNRLNIVVFGYGEEHGDTYEDYGGAPTIFSIDLTTGKISIIHFSRDIRTPELERLPGSDPSKPMVLRRIYKAGGTDEKGFELTRRVIGSMSGLVADYQIIMKDLMLRDMIAYFSGGKLELDVPKDHDTQSFRLGRAEYPGALIKKGRQTLNLMDLMRYVLAEDKNPNGKADERSYRKNQVTKALMQQLGNKFKEKPLHEKIVFLNQIKDFIAGEITSKNLELEFDPGLLSKAISGILNVASKFVGKIGQDIEFTIPQIDENKGLVIHDLYFGDGTVGRAHVLYDTPNTYGRKDNPRVLEEIRASAQNNWNTIPGWMLIPDGGDPYSSDLVKDYWFPIRKRVKKVLTS